jgi:hypothetical protein
MKSLRVALLAALYFAHGFCLAQSTPDPGTAGPMAVTKAEYNLGDLAATLPSFPSAV